MSTKGDTERQAILRDRLIERGIGIHIGRYISRILPHLKPGSKLCDIGCGTAHIVAKLTEHCRDPSLIGLDTSQAMLRVAAERSANSQNVILVRGDGLRLPFRNETFDIVITRLAEYSPLEAFRVLRNGGCFFEYGLGPEANKEIAEFFPDRIEEENFFFPRHPTDWKMEVCDEILDAGFSVERVEDHTDIEIYESTSELMDLIEMVPLVQDFDRNRDRKRIDDLKQRYGTKTGIPITWHYYIVEAMRK
ncbi:MAG: class I SAM-dependent methyltransferase [Thermoplasmata archaeon]